LIIVDGTVNGRDTIKFILDTGAELTLIPRSLVQQLAISLDSSIDTPVTGIGGTIIAPLVKIGSLKVGEAEIRNLDGLIENALLTGQGLLGGNFLGKFRVEIDYTKNQLILERKVGTGE
jgi:aspartyl protease family protein